MFFPIVLISPRWECHATGWYRWGTFALGGGVIPVQACCAKEEGAFAKALIQLIQGLVQLCGRGHALQKKLTRFLS